jgi:hypothetical protein
MLNLTITIPVTAPPFIRFAMPRLMRPAVAVIDATSQRRERGAHACKAR